MAGLNRITIVGHLGSDPSLRDANGKAVCSFSVAVNERKDQPPTWFRVTAWEKTADLCAQYLRKGQLVLVEGRVKLNEFEGKEGKVTQLEVVASNVTFLEKADGGAREERRDTAPSRSPSSSSDGAVLPNYGRSAGAPIVGASVSDLNFYRSGCERSLGDAAKSRFHEKERALLRAIDAELARQQGGGGGNGGQPPRDFRDDAPLPDDGDIPFAYPPSRSVTEVGGHAYRRAVWRNF